MIAWASMALAGTPVVFDGEDGAAVVQEVASRTGLPADQLDAVPLDDLLKGAPEALGDAVLRRCTRDGVQGDTIRTELARAEAAWGAEDRVAAFDHLDLAVAQLGCLTELPDKKVAARVFLLRGALLAVDRPDDASGEIRTALAFQPDLPWDPAFPAEGEMLVEMIQQHVTGFRLRVIPDSSTSGPWIDGREVPEDGYVDVGAGLHLTQYTGPKGVESAWLVVGGTSTLVLPQAFRRPVLDKIADDYDRRIVEALLGATVPDLEAAYVAWSDGLWLVTPDPEDLFSTMEIAPPAAAEPDEVPEDDGKGKKKGKKGKKGK